MTIALAQNRRERRGTAAREERICPEEYSPVMTSAPRTATTICPKGAPRIAIFQLPEPKYSGLEVMTVARAPIPVVMTRVMTAVTQVERRVRSLIHSERTARTRV